MTQFVIANNVDTQLATAATSSATTLTLASSVNLPTLSAGQIMPLTLNDAATGLVYEVVYVTAISGVTLTVMRAQEGTGAQNWNVGDYAFCAPTQGTTEVTTGNPNLTFMVAPATASNMAPTMAQATGVVGSTRNLSMVVAAASATATLTADEIIVETALGGLRYCLPSFNKTINLATTGAGGMDTGTATANGFVGIYAIWNPTTGTAALLGTMEASTPLPSIYGGANMPAGYTASALLTVVPITSTAGQFAPVLVQGRRISFNYINALSTTSVVSAATLPLSAYVPKTAIAISGAFGLGNSTGASMQISAFPRSSSQAGLQTTQGYTYSGAGVLGNFNNLPVQTPQTIYYTTSGPSSGSTWTINLSSYQI